jgi:hypothetical protein
VTAPTIDLRDHLPAFEAAALRLLGRRPRHYDRYDHVLVERIIAGEHRGTIGVIDAAEVVRRMARRGYSDGQIAYRLGRTTRSVLRVRRRLGIPPVVLSRGANQYALAHPEAPTRHWRAG